MNKFTDTVKVLTYSLADGLYTLEHEVTVTNDAADVADGDVKVAWFCHRTCKLMEEYFEAEEMPTYAEIAEMVRVSEQDEHADAVDDFDAAIAEIEADLVEVF